MALHENLQHQILPKSFEKHRKYCRKIVYTFTVIEPTKQLLLPEQLFENNWCTDFNSNWTDSLATDPRSQTEGQMDMISK
jgi:hypothetical protein